MLVYRQATIKGDLVLTWRDRTLRIEGRLATAKERTLLRAWAMEHRLQIQGSLDDLATVEAEPESLKKALADLVGKGVGEAGYVVYAVDKKGRARVVHKHDVPISLEDVVAVSKVPAVAGG